MQLSLFEKQKEPMRLETGYERLMMVGMSLKVRSGLAYFVPAGSKSIGTRLRRIPIRGLVTSGPWENYLISSIFPVCKKAGMVTATKAAVRIQSGNAHSHSHYGICGTRYECQSARALPCGRARAWALYTSTPRTWAAHPQFREGPPGRKPPPRTPHQ